MRRGMGFFACLVFGGVAGLFARPPVDAWRARAQGDAAVAVALMHAALDVELGRGAEACDNLQQLAGRATSPPLRGRVLALWAQAAAQAGRLPAALRAADEEYRLVEDAPTRRAVALEAISLAGTLGQKSQAEAWARPLIEGADPAVSDEARLRLTAATMTPAELKAWTHVASNSDVETARRAGLAALRILGDAESAVRLLSPIVNDKSDASLEVAMLDAYTASHHPADAARVAARLAALVPARAGQLDLVRAQALADSGDLDRALATLDEVLRRSDGLDERRLARRLRFVVLQRQGRLPAAIAEMEKKGDLATRAFVALEVEGNFALATELYTSLSRRQPDSLELAEGAREAARRKDLAERRDAYQQLLAKDPADDASRERLLAMLVALGDAAGARRAVEPWLAGPNGDPRALVLLTRSLWHAGLAEDAAEVLARAYASQPDRQRKQEIQFLAADLFAGTQKEAAARRMFVELAARGESPQIRALAVDRLTALLNI